MDNNFEKFSGLITKEPKTFGTIISTQTYQIIVNVAGNNVRIKAEGFSASDIGKMVIIKGDSVDRRIPNLSGFTNTI